MLQRKSEEVRSTLLCPEFSFMQEHCTRSVSHELVEYECSKRQWCIQLKRNNQLKSAFLFFVSLKSSYTKKETIKKHPTNPEGLNPQYLQQRKY